MPARSAAASERPATCGSTPSTLGARFDALEANFKKLEKQLTQTVDAQRTRKGIEQIVSESMVLSLRKVEEELCQLSELYVVIRDKLSDIDLPSMQRKLQSLKDELADVRTIAQTEFKVLWTHISNLEELQGLTPEPGADEKAKARRRRASSKAKHSSSGPASRKKTSSSRKYPLRESKHADSE